MTVIPSCRLFVIWQVNDGTSSGESLGAFICFPQWHVSPKELFLTLTSIVETSRFLSS